MVGLLMASNAKTPLPNPEGEASVSFNPNTGLFTGKNSTIATAGTPAPGTTPGTTPFKAPAQVDDSVATRVANLTKGDSPIMQVARTEGLKAANRRGLLNSSLAAGASERAMIEAALPIASQDAAQAFGKNQASQAFQFDQELQNAAISATERQQIRDIASREGLAAAERQLQGYLQQQNLKYEAGQRSADRIIQEQIASWNLKSSDRNAAATFLTNMESFYNSSVQSIMANTNLTAEQRTQQLSSARGLRDRQLNFVEQMYDIDLEWGDSAPVPTATGTTTPATAQQPAGYRDNGGVGGAGGGTVLCTYFRNKELLDPAIYAADLAYAAEHVSDDAKAGYHAWAIPLVSLLETGRYPVTERVALFFVSRWAGEMARVMGLTDKTSLTGRVMRVIGEPLCAMIGRFAAKGRRAAI